VDKPEAESPPSRLAKVAAELGNGTGTGGCEPACDDLPLRTATDRVRGHRIRYLDDPEILERVLEGLLNLS
jgi:hypothetical protein